MEVLEREVLAVNSSRLSSSTVPWNVDLSKQRRRKKYQNKPRSCTSNVKISSISFSFQQTASRMPDFCAFGKNKSLAPDEHNHKMNWLKLKRNFKWPNPANNMKIRKVVVYVQDIHLLWKETVECRAVNILTFSRTDILSWTVCNWSTITVIRTHFCQSSSRQSTKTFTNWQI